MTLFAWKVLVLIALVLLNVRGALPRFVAVAAAEKGKEKFKKMRKSDLVMTKLVVMVRHGHCSPAASYWDLCPADRKNRHHYDVNAEDLTGRGMKEEYELGQHLRHKYANFIGKRFNRTLHFFRAVGEPRILQSAVAVSQGVFPDGFGPGGYLPSRPQFVPVFSDMDTHEYLLDDVPCFRRAEADVRQWVNNSLRDFLADPNVAGVLKYMKEVCGKSKGERPLYEYLKTVADGMIFNTDYGLKVCGGRISHDMLYRIRNVSLEMMMARLYRTDEQKTYTAVDLPFRLLHMMQHRQLPKETELNDFLDTRQESVFYFFHREGLYALAQFFGFSYSVPGLPRGELPVASAFIVERLEPRHASSDDGRKKVYVKISLWTPRIGTSTIEVSQCKVPQLCKLQELQRIYEERVGRTGTWDKLCNYTFSDMDHNTNIR